jgi:hypothetical protein
LLLQQWEQRQLWLAREATTTAVPMTMPTPMAAVVAAVDVDVDEAGGVAAGVDVTMS